MKSILMSIKPKYVELIASGQKTIEVRKSKPNIDTPFKCYIYCTNGNGTLNDTLMSSDRRFVLNQKVIGEFVCGRIICSQAYFDSQGKNHLTNIFEEDIKRTCLTEYELWNYIAGKAVKANEMYDGYLWHIYNLKIYDKPKELREFKKPCDRFLDCITCKRLVRNDFLSCDNIITRPPQSWCYVEGE